MMNQSHDALEEGEISNDSDCDDYTPLDRPADYSCSLPQPRLPVNLEPESEEEFTWSESSSDSDSDKGTSKRRRVKLRPPQPTKPTTSKKKKYDIWSSRLEGDTLSETLLNSCDVINKDRSRLVESYDYTLAYKYYGQNNQGQNDKARTNNKRTRDDRKNPNCGQGKKSSSNEKIKGAQRIIPVLKCDANDNADDLARDIANKLCEEKEDLILKVINTLGKVRAIEIFKETREIEEDGGMLILNHKRRRTPGGVFLFLVRNDYNITFAQRNEIFGDERQKHKVMLKSKQKAKMMRLKRDMALAGADRLPELLSTADLLTSQNLDWKRKDNNEETDFTDPPPTPETDGHDNSGDGMEVQPTNSVGGPQSNFPIRQINVYEEDFLDIGSSADMDLF